MAAAPSRGEWTTVQSKGPNKAPKKKQMPCPTIDQRSFKLKISPPTHLLTQSILDITSRINRTLHQEGVNDVRVDRMRQNANGRLLGTTTPLSMAETLFRHRDLVQQAARTLDTSITSLDPFEKWGWVKIHGVSLLGYMEKGSSGLQKLREELEAENGGIRSPLRPGGWAGQGPAYTSRYVGSNGHAWCWRWWERR